VALGVVLLLLAGVASGVDGESNGNAKPKSRTNRSNTSAESGARARSDDEVEFDEYGQIKE
jgi:hypothetical protein